MSLRRRLEALDATVDRQAAVARDPIGVVRDRAPAEREIAAHVAALMAYGSARAIRVAVSDVFEALGPDLVAALDTWRPGDFVRVRPDFVYRMTRAEDVDALLTGLARVRVKWGGLEAAFAASVRPEEPDLQTPLTAWIARLREASGAADRRGLRYLLPDPATGSATKRLHLLLRWLVRPDDGVDLGCWTCVDPSRLLLPLDTHTSRLSQCLGLTTRRTVDLRMAREVTAALRTVRPSDPVGLDLALCHLGMSGGCLHRYEATVCGSCPLRAHCVHPAQAVSPGRLNAVADRAYTDGLVRGGGRSRSGEGR